MDDWDLETLEKVVESKGKEYNQKNQPTSYTFLSSYFITYQVFISYRWIILALYLALKRRCMIIEINYYCQCPGVCKHFLNAMEKKQYGWFWVCPNGNKECHYRHALPPGYILKSQMKALLEEEANKLAIEDEIEDQVIIIFTNAPFFSLTRLHKTITNVV
ncbi:putative transcription factor C3H family [Helianthus anomalus]